MKRARSLAFVLSVTLASTYGNALPEEADKSVGSTAANTMPAAPSPAQLSADTSMLDAINPVRPLPPKLLGFDQAVGELQKKPSPAKVRLGRWLYFDKRISADATISCATCHDPRYAFSEPRPVSIGIRGQKGTRKAPSFVNAAYAFLPHQFWDGRAADLEAQAIGPMANPIEMGNTHQVVVQTIRGIKGYEPFFKEAFGDPEIDLSRIAEAIADYERTRLSGNSAYDRWKSGKDEKAVSEEVKLGDKLFFGKALCSRCHVGNNFGDSLFHNIGVGWDEKAKKFKDDGRAMHTKKDEDKGKFKTPGLRDIALRAPYMHDGSMATLEEVMEHYRKGGTPNPTLDQKMEKLDLTDAESTAIIRMMQSLTGEGWVDTEPALFPR